MDDEAAILELLAVKGPLSTPEVADAVGVNRRAADYRLRTLYADGKLESTSLGNTLLWWVPDEVANGSGTRQRAVSE